MNDLREKTEWTGEHLGIHFEINRFPGFKFASLQQNKWAWTFYLFLWIDRIPENAESYWLEGKKVYNRISYDYYGHGVLSSIEWHGGITWYSKESGFDGEKRVIKVGCDFQHLYDHEHGDYELGTVVREAKEAIESFRAMVPGYRYWCRYDGKLHDPKDVVIAKDGSYACECKSPVLASK